MAATDPNRRFALLDVAIRACIAELRPSAPALSSLTAALHSLAITGVVECVEVMSAHVREQSADATFVLAGVQPMTANVGEIFTFRTICADTPEARE